MGTETCEGTVDDWGMGGGADFVAYIILIALEKSWFFEDRYKQVEMWRVQFFLFNDILFCDVM